MQGTSWIIIISVTTQSGGSFGEGGEEGCSGTLGPLPPPFLDEPGVIWSSLCAMIRVLEYNVRVCSQTYEGSSSLAGLWTTSEEAFKLMMRLSRAFR